MKVPRPAWALLLAMVLLHPGANHIVIGELPLRVLMALRRIGTLGWLALCFAVALLGLVLALLLEWRRQRRVAPVPLEALA